MDIDNIDSKRLESYNKTFISDINMTPFVDVCLVLLIIFMVTAPFAIGGIDVDLPKDKFEQVKVAKRSIVLSIDSKNRFYIDKQKVLSSKLISELQKHIKDKKNSILYIRSDKTVHYEKIMKVMNDAKKAGIKKVALIGYNTQN